MKDWSKFTALAAIVPDMLFWMQDYHKHGLDRDEILLALCLLYQLEDLSLVDDLSAGLLTILDQGLWGTRVSLLRFMVTLDDLAALHRAMGGSSCTHV